MIEILEQPLQNPKLYRAIVGAVGAGRGSLRIAAAFGPHHRTVLAVRDANPERIDIARSKRVGCRNLDVRNNQLLATLRPKVELKLGPGETREIQPSGTGAIAREIEPLRGPGGAPASDERSDDLRHFAQVIPSGCHNLCHNRAPETGPIAII